MRLTVPDPGEIQGFVPTRDELIQLVKHWAKTVLHRNYWEFVTDQIVSSQIDRSFAHRRIERIEKLLGDKEVDNAINEEKAELSKHSSGWDIFLNGTEEQQEALREEYQQAMIDPEKKQREI